MVELGATVSSLAKESEVDDLPHARIDPKAPPHVLLHMPVDVRSMALVVLTVIAVLAVLRWANAFFIPLMLGLVFSYALSPLVDALERYKLPRSLSAGALILMILGGMGLAVYSLSDDANDLVTSLPEAARKVRDTLHRSPQATDTTLDSVQKAAAELQKAADEAGAQRGAQPRSGVAHVIVDKPHFDLRDHLWSGTVGLATVIGQAVIVTCLTYFMLISGDTFRRKLVKITGPTLSDKKLTVQALDEINAQMQRYLLVQLMASVGTGVATGVCFAVMGLNHAAVWGVAAGVLNLVPYVGPIAVTASAALVAFLQFGEPRMAFMVGGASLVIDTVKGYVIVPWATSKAARMNAVAVFVGVLAFGWLWGVWGLLLGMPILMAVKAICDRVDHLKAVGELLGT
jgi:predicted PurR-regulated permease PerM